jgi:hypothetical protein
MTKGEVRALAGPITAVAALICVGYALATIPPGYKGKPFRDQSHKSGPQVIPGTVQLALYDLGGEGVGYHTVAGNLQHDPTVNEGAKLNHKSFMHKQPDGTTVQMNHCRPGVPEYICYFRENEAVSISYVKDFADLSHPNMFDPPANQLYVGWEQVGEWTNYTVRVKKAGTYKVIALYASSRAGDAKANFQVDIDNQPTECCKLPVPTGREHVWNKGEVGKITFGKTGLQLLTVHYNNGNNLAYLEFNLQQNK